MDTPRTTHCDRCNTEFEVLNGKYAVYLLCRNCGTNTYESYRGKCCDEPNVQKVNLPNVNGNPSVRDFCWNCGTTSSALKTTSVHSVSALPKISQEDRDKRRQKFYDESKRFRAWAESKSKEIFFQEHDQYLKSDAWKQLRAKVLKRDEYLCQCCLEAKATQVHHLTYERWKQEAAFDLVSICTPCHDRIHSTTKD